MPPQLALLLCIFFVIWLFAQDRKRRGNVSAALWLPLIWMAILGSRPVSSWFGRGREFEDLEGYLTEGSPFDRNIYIFLIGAGLFVLARRRASWRAIIAHNRWLFIYFFYLGLSTLWSDYTAIAIKRWIKDFGNVIMVLIILSEADPQAAIKSVLARCSYLLIPFSVLVIKYYPDIGRYYDRWTWQPHYGGLTSGKNLLGLTLLVCGVSLVWIWLEVRTRNHKNSGRTQEMVLLSLIVMTAWLLLKSDSATSLVCAILGAGILLAMRIPTLRSKMSRIGASSFVILPLLVLLIASLNLEQVFLKSLGRDMTLTGRTEIWRRVLSEEINPLIGVGFYSYWLGDRVERMSQEFHMVLNEAHNGYLETYANSGWIGLVLLLVLLNSAAKEIRRESRGGTGYAGLQLAFLVVAAVYNLTESAFNRLALIWFVLLLVIIKYPRPIKVKSETKHEPLREERESATCSAV